MSVETENKKITFKQEWIKDQFDKIRLVVSQKQKSDEELIYFLNKKYETRVEPEHTLVRVGDNLERYSFEDYLDKFYFNNKDIMTSYGTTFKQQDEHIGVPIKFLIRSGERRSELKSKMLNSTLSYLVSMYNAGQLTTKLSMNAYYGNTSMPSFIFYSPIVANSITLTGQDLTSTGVIMTEAYAENNFVFETIDLCIDYIKECKINFNKNYEKTETSYSLLDNVSHEVVYKHFLTKLRNTDKYPKWRKLLKDIINNLTNEEVKALYYYNNMEKIYVQKYPMELIKTMLKHARVGIKEVYQQAYNSFQVLMKDVCEIYYMFPDRFKKYLKNQRDTILVIDTDSNFICVNNFTRNIMEKTGHNNSLDITQIAIEVFKDHISFVYNNYLKKMHISPKYWGRIVMESEYDYQRVLVSEGKKNYAGAMLAKLGKPFDKLKADIKGLPIKKKVINAELRDTWEELLMWVLSNDHIKLSTVLTKFSKIKENVTNNLKEGKVNFLKPLSIKDRGSYAKPTSQAGFLGANAWNYLEPEKRIEIPGKVNLIKLKEMTIQDFESSEFKETYPEKFKIIKEKIFRDKYAVSNFEDDKKENCLKYISIPYSLEQIPEYLLSLMDVDLIVQDNIQSGQILLKSLGVEISDNFIKSNILTEVERKCNIDEIDPSFSMEDMEDFDDE